MEKGRPYLLDLIHTGATIKIGALEKGYYGSFDNVTNTITIDIDKFRKFQRENGGDLNLNIMLTLTHEAQHAIDRKNNYNGYCDSATIGLPQTEREQLIFDIEFRGHSKELDFYYHFKSKKFLGINLFDVTKTVTQNIEDYRDRPGPGSTLGNYIFTTYVEIRDQNVRNRNWNRDYAR